MKRSVFTLLLTAMVFLFCLPAMQAQDYSGTNPQTDYFRHNGYSPIYGKVSVDEGDTLARIRFRGHVNAPLWHTATEITSWITGPVTDYDFPSNLVFKTDSMFRMSILHNGNVGVNTVSPQQLFTVSHLDMPVIRFDRAGGGNSDYEIYNGLNGTLYFRGGADAVGPGLTDYVVMTAQGRVGIGTTQPDQILTVSDAEPIVRLERAGADNDIELVTATDGDLEFRGGADGTAGALNHLVVFEHDGDVGIGTNTPDQLLTVSDDEPVFRMERAGSERDVELINAADGDLEFRGGADGTGGALNHLVVFEYDGDVGIGTNAPDQLLTLSEGDNPVLRLDRTDTDAFDMELSLQDDGDLYFRGGADEVGNNLNDLMLLTNEGKLAIGTTMIPTSVGPSDVSFYSLFAAGGILTEEIRVRTGWADYVFAPDYQLRPLSEISGFIASENRLPDMPTAEEVETGGLELGDMTVRQQEKIEELFLYMIEMDKELDALRTENEALRARVEELER